MKRFDICSVRTTPSFNPLLLSGFLILNFPSKSETCYLVEDMISSKFILDILDLLLDGDEAGKTLRPQIDYLTDAKYNYTGVGVFVTFLSSTGIENYRYPEDKVVLDGVSITSTELGILGASTILFVSNGVLDTLEIFSYDGGYPRRELSDYTLKQEGNLGFGREIKSPG